METNNKYYTPDKSEYHIGFEYQSLTDPRQPENDIAWSNEELRTEVDMMNVFKYMIEDDFMEHRCKFLDKEDLESFGFKCQWYEKGEYSFVKDDILISVNDIDIKKLFITNMKCGMDIRKCLFQGIIKNKSELKVLLKQLQLL